MKLNHLSLTLPDVAATAAFMQQYLDFQLQEVKGDKIAVLRGTGDFVMVLTTLRAGDGPYPADFHFGFILDGQEEVQALYQQMTGDGYTIPRAPAKIRDSYAFYFHIPGGIMAEISCNL